MEENIREANINVERAKAIATIVVTAIVNILNVFGWAVDADIWITVTTSVISAVAIVWCWWKNQNVTEAAVVGQLAIDAIKLGEAEYADSAKRVDRLLS